ncbi:MAG: aminotransferase class I/II-fold pyridoxal phosphate-dependent enzyme [Alphaproteobacteria bacterium]|nr:aminotransferase class I/II-fold pyridoxal phosphate-dependent enzyme [Alphaproteobacteria bacterium]
MDQQRAPIYEALVRFKNVRVVPFDVPGHKQGKETPELTAFLGEQCMKVDANSMKQLDFLSHPVSVIKEAEELAAEAFGAHHAFFIVNGTTQAVQAMIMTAAKRGDKIIMPRNVHKSVINALIIIGAVPVYVNPSISSELGIPLGMALADVEKAIIQNPDAKAVFVNNPTYYGICPQLKAITDLAHKHNMLTLVDEAHGTHFYFGKNLPVSAMAAGADMAAVSMHKSGGSLTQSSFLLLGKKMNVGYTRQIISLTQTTSASYLLLVSLDLARKNMALNGREIFSRVCELSQYARDEVNKIGDYYAFGREIINGDSIYDFDVTKLFVNTLKIGLTGFKVYDILMDEYNIHIEFGDAANLIAFISVGDRKQDLERLLSSFAEIRRRYKKDKTVYEREIAQDYIQPELAVIPQEAFYGNKKSILLKDSAGHICCESVISYPPGIPILAPGEKITKDIVDFIEYAKERGYLLIGAEDKSFERINVLEGK